MIDRTHRLAVTRQARLLALSHAAVYYAPRPVPAADLELMRRMDALHLELLFAGSRMLAGLLDGRGLRVESMRRNSVNHVASAGKLTHMRLARDFAKIE